MKPTFFVISTNQFHKHHLDKERWPYYTVNLPASVHAVVRAFQKMEPSDENYMILHNFIKSLSMVELQMDRELGEKERG